MWKWHIHVLKTRFPTAQAPAPGGGRRLRRGAAVPRGGVGPLLGRTRRRRVGRRESRDRHGRRGAASRHYGGVALRRLAFRRPAGRVCIVRGERELPRCCAVVAGGVVGRVCRTRGCRQRTGTRGLARLPAQVASRCQSGRASMRCRGEWLHQSTPSLDPPWPQATAPRCPHCRPDTL